MRDRTERSLSGRDGDRPIAAGASLLERLTERLATRQCLTAPLLEVSARLVSARPEASGIVSLVTGLYDPGLDPRWLPALWPCTQLVILTTAVGLGVSRLARQELVRDLRKVRAAFGKAATPPTRLFHLATPFAAFHLSMWRRAAARRSTPYVAVAALIHVRARALENEMLGRAAEFGPKLQRNIWDYLLSARVLCRYGSALDAMSTPLRRTLIDAAGL
jgi:hypothetical protein